MSFKILFIFTFWFSCCLPYSVVGQVTDKKDLPETQVASLLVGETSFPDDLYAAFQWEGFENSEAANADIKLDHIDYNLLNAGVFYYSNLYRTSKKLPPLEFSKALRDAACIHSIEMINRVFFNHVNSRNKKLKTPVDRARYFNYPNDYVGENIAIDVVLENYTYGPNGEDITFRTYQALCKAIVDGWIKSKPHKKNLLDKTYKYLGCAVVVDRTTVSRTKFPQAYATQCFGQ